MWHGIDGCDMTRVVAGWTQCASEGVVCPQLVWHFLSWCGMSLVGEVWCQLVWQGLSGYGRCGMVSVGVICLQLV